MIGTISLAFALLLSVQEQPAEHNAAEAASEPLAEAPIAPQSAAVAEDDDKVICRRTAIIGSRFKKRICGTKRQWETLEAKARETTQDWQRRGKGLEPNDSNKPGG